MIVHTGGTRIRLIDVWAAIGVMLVSSDIGYFPYRYFQGTCVKMRHQTHTSILNPDDLHTYIHVMRYILYRVNSFLLYHSRHASVRVLMVITFKAPRGAIGGPLVLVSTIFGAAGVHHGVTLSWQTKGVGDSHLLIH